VSEFSVHVCRTEDMHPYECDGPGKCVHCDRKTTEHHKVTRCAFCHEDRNRKRRAAAAKNDTSTDGCRICGAHEMQYCSCGIPDGDEAP
jgi:hypothetical protein